MSTYNYGPPPPPPSASAGTGYGLPSGPYAQHGQNHRGGGGGVVNSRRGGHHHGSRGDYRGTQPHYEYTGQPYPTHNPVPFGGPHPPTGSYPPHQAQWAPPEHGSVPPHHVHAHAHAHVPAPLSASNYHPNYAPQAYSPAQYPQQAPYGSPQPYPYQGTMAPSQPQWNGQGSHQAPYGSIGGRGGYNDRGGQKPSHVGAPVRHDAAPLQMNAGFGQPYPHYPPAQQYPYAAPPAAPAPSTHPAHSHQDSFRGQYPRRGRGGGHRDGNVRGRGGHHNHHHGGDKSRHHKQQPQQQQQQQQPLPQQQNTKKGNNQKQEPPSVGRKKKRKTNTLGLTPGVDSESEDDEEEEKVLAELIGQDGPRISDVAAFLAARRKNYPTRERIEAKKAAELAQKEEKKKEKKKTKGKDKDESESESIDAEAARLEEEADKLRRQLRKVEFSIKRKREQGDEGDEMRDRLEESSDDEPEVMSTRSQAHPPPPPAKKADVTRHCKYYATGGTCGKKGKCRFVHDPQVRERAIKEREANDGRLTLSQRLILNDKQLEDMAILKSIQYLREKGVMASAGVTVGKSDGDKNPSTKPAPPPNSGFSHLPAASPSLPPPPVKREPPLPPLPAKGEAPRRTNPPPSIIPSANSISSQGLKHYQGWLLKPYGSTSGKQNQSDDLP